MGSLTRRTLETISSMARPAWATCSEPLSTFSTDLPIRGLISLAASALRPARLRYFAGDDRKAAALFACAGRFHGGVQGRDVGLEGDAVNDADDVADLAGAFGNLLHAGDHLAHHFATAGGGLGCSACELVGLAGGVG